MLWPFATRSTVERLELELWSAKQQAHELRHILGLTQVELAKHKQLLSGRAGTMKVLRETVAVVSE